MTDEKTMPHEIYAGQDKGGDTYWTRGRHESFDLTDVLKQTHYIRADHQWKPIPLGWHISWFGPDDGMYTCQLKRHDNDLDYKSDLSLVSRREYTMHEAYAAAVDVILKEYGEIS